MDIPILPIWLNMSESQNPHLKSEKRISLRPMKLWLLIWTSAILMVSCKSDFELVRTSGDSNKILAAANGYYDNKEYQKAITLYEIIIPVMRGKPGGEEMFFKYADAHFLLRSYILAAHYFKNFSDTYGNSELREDALFMTAYSNYKLSPRFRLDQTSSENAINGLQLFVNTYPDSERVKQCNELIDELRSKQEIKEFESGKLYYNMKKYSAAVVTLENMINDFPGSDREVEARYIIAKAQYSLAQNSIYSVQEERFTDALKSCNRFIKKYPDSKYIKEISKFKDDSLNALNQTNNG